MNIFVLDKDPQEAARYHNDKHVLKMILETSQMLSTAHWVFWLEKLGKSRSDFRLVRDMKAYLEEHVPAEFQPPCKLTHQNHPCSVWVRETVANYFWAARLMRGLLDQYRLRYKKRHSHEWKYKWLNKNVPPGIPDLPLTNHALCVPPDCKISIDPATCYQEYYRKHKRHIAKWKNLQPSWWY